MYCLSPACASACVTGALSKKDNGTVYYYPDKCIGCRYCMIAYLFEIPAYEYHKVIYPKVMKCMFCFERVEKQSKLPGCAAIFPTQANYIWEKRKDAPTG